MLGFLSRFVDSNDRELKRIHRGESVGALFSSEVEFTQEMLLWEDGVAKKLDIRNEPDHAADADTVDAAMLAAGKSGER